MTYDFNPLEQSYLGDGAYAEYHGYDVVIYTNRAGTRHYIALEPNALQVLVNMVRDRGWRIV